MKAEYFNKQEEFSTENLMEPWKETFTREEVETLISGFAKRFSYNIFIGKLNPNLQESVEFTQKWLKENL